MYLMAKFIFSMGNENYRKLQLEAKTRDVTIQALIRTVVIPEWIRTHIDTTTTNTQTNIADTSSLLGHSTGFLSQSHRSLPSSVGRRS
jgi:tryptophan 2,3-dioxygenase